MSGADDWGQPPRTIKGQFAKGVSGNRRGRPKKAERAFTSSQVRHDFLSLMETVVPTKILGKSEHLPASQVINWRMILKAIDGDAKMILACQNKHDALMHDHKVANWDAISALETFEKMLLANGGPIDDGTMGLLNDLRKRTRGDLR